MPSILVNIMKKEDQKLFQANDLIVFIIRNWKLFGVVAFVAAVLSAIFSGPAFIRPKYKSETIIFATTTPSVSQALTVEDNPYRKNVMEFGEEEETEQLIQILNSDRIRNQIIKEFDLGTHYRLNPNDKEYINLLYFMYGQNVSVKKTKYISIDVQVLDFSPDTAALIANRIVNLVDKYYYEVRQHRAKEALVVLDKQFNKITLELKGKDDRLREINKTGLISLELQAERLTEQYAIALRANDQSGAKRIKKEFDKLAIHAAEWLRLEDSSELLQENLDLVRMQRDNLMIDANETMSSRFVINEAYPAVKKSYPIRWLIVVASVFAAIAFTFVLQFVIKSVKEVKAAA